MKTPLRISAACFGLVVSALLTSCASSIHKPAVVILIASPSGVPLSPGEQAFVQETLRPEIEKRGYVIAPNRRFADYSVYVRNPSDPLAGPLTFVRLQPDQTTNTDRAAATRAFQEAAARTNRDMIAEPSRETR